MSIIRWLHISDLHYGYESYVTTEMRTNMLKSLPNILTGESQPKYLFITGDLRYGRNCEKEFPKEIVNDIKELMKAFSIPSERVHIVIGNHDVVRELGRIDIAPLLRNDYAHKNGNLDNDRMSCLEQSQQKFYEVYKSICNRESVPYHALIEEPDFNIICLNTSFACSNDHEDGDLIVGMKLLQETLKKINASKPGIVLAHHGFESLQPKEREYLEIKLKESGALLYLCGHEHLADSRNITARRENQPLFEYICGTGIDKLPSGQSAEMVIFMGELDTKQRNGYIRAWEWRDRSMAWLPYSDISYKQTSLPDGYHYFPKPPTQKIIAKKIKGEGKKMDNETFRKQVENKLKKMSREQIVFFTWLCAVRALPFIGKNGNFAYWQEEENRKKHLYALFRALDANNYNHDVVVDVSNVGIAAAYTAASADITDDAGASAITFATAAANAFLVTTVDTVVDAVYFAADAAIAAVDTVDIAPIMQNILLADINNLQKGGVVHNNLKLYGKVWDNFQRALDKEGCSYWGRLYRDIFEKSFKLDKEALQRRMSVPIDTQEKGADAVALYLEELEKEAKTKTNSNEIEVSQKFVPTNPSDTLQTRILQLFNKKMKCKRFYNVQNRIIDLKGLQADMPQKFNIGLGSFTIDTKYYETSEKLQMLDLLQYSLSNDINGISNQNQRDTMLKKIIETKTQMLEIIMQLNK